MQLLNRYVKKAVTRTGFEPYVVRMQVSLMPRARNLPYDAYTTLSFFSSEAFVPSPSTPAAKAAAAEAGVRGSGGASLVGNASKVLHLADTAVAAGLADAEDFQLPEGLYRSCSVLLQDCGVRGAINQEETTPIYQVIARWSGEPETFNRAIKNLRPILRSERCGDAACIAHRLEAIHYVASTIKRFGRWLNDPERTEMPYVIPLLVTDNQELTRHSRTVDTVR